MSSQSPFNGAPVGFADTVNGAGKRLSELDCGNGVQAGTKCSVGPNQQLWTLTPSAAVPNHVNIEKALNFPAMRWIVDPSQGVLSAPNVVALSALPTVGTLPTGSIAFVASSALPGGTGSQVFILVPAIAPGSPNAQNVCATSDDPSRQWVALSVVMAVEERYVSQEIKLTNAGQTDVVPGIRGKTFVPTRFEALITSAAGAFANPAFFRIGNPSAVDNMLALTDTIFEGTLFGVGTRAYFAGSVDSSSVTGRALIADEGVQIGLKQGADGPGMDWKAKVQITGCYI